jgi:hypothetical protein
MNTYWTVLAQDGDLAEFVLGNDSATTIVAQMGSDEAEAQFLGLWLDDQVNSNGCIYSSEDALRFEVQRQNSELENGYGTLAYDLNTGGRIVSFTAQHCIDAVRRRAEDERKYAE